MSVIRRYGSTIINMTRVTSVKVENTIAIRVFEPGNKFGRVIPVHNAQQELDEIYEALKRQFLDNSPFAQE